MLEYAKQFGQPVKLITPRIDGVAVVLESQKQPLAGVGYAAVINGYRVAETLVDERGHV